jgi:rsbT antagonist protein RsbS
MGIPVLKQGDCLIAYIQHGMSDDEWLVLRRTMADGVRGHRARSVVIDVSGLDALDSFATRMLRSIGLVARLGGARTVIAGIAPDVAYAMAQLGLTLDEVDTALDLEHGLERARVRDGGNRTGAE